MKQRFSVERDKEDLLSLWIECFPGDEKFRDYFMAEIYDPSNTLVVEEDGRVISMAHILPMEIDYHGKAIPAAYIFAVGTHPAYRGRGLAANLLEQIYAELHQREIPLVFLVPQKDELFAYYKRFGFAESFGLSHQKLVRNQLPQNPVLSEYELIRSNLTGNSGGAPGEWTNEERNAANDIFEKVMKYRTHLLRTPEHWTRAVKIAEIADGALFTLKSGGEAVGYAICEWVGDDLLINELLAMDEASYNTLCAGVLQQMNAESATMLTTACPHDVRRFGLVRVLDAEKMLSYAAEYRGTMECAFDLLDPNATWNTANYKVQGTDVKRTDFTGSRAYITPEQLSGILFGAGPIPYMNLLFS